MKPRFNFLLFLIALLLPAYTCQAADEPPCGGKAPIKVVGSYTDMRYTEEHAYGYSVELWRQSDRLFGFFLASDGLAGDTPTGLLEDVKYDAGTGRLSFTARLTTGLVYNKKYQGVPSRDVFRFDGVLSKGSLTGALEVSDALTPETLPRREDVVLKYSQESTATLRAPDDCAEWWKQAQVILKRLGPKW